MENLYIQMKQIEEQIDEPKYEQCLRCSLDYQIETKKKRGIYNYKFCNQCNNIINGKIKLMF